MRNSDYFKMRMSSYFLAPIGGYFEMRIAGYFAVRNQGYFYENTQSMSGLSFVPAFLQSKAHENSKSEILLILQLQKF